MKRSALVFFLIILFSSVGMPLSYAEEEVLKSGQISGSVSNGTAEDRQLPGLDIVIQKFNGATLLDSVQGKTNEKGRFAFEGLEVNPNVAYYLQTSYMEIGYSSEPVVLDMENPSRSIDLKVYEKSEDASNIQFDNYHMIIRRGFDGLEVQEIVSVRNGAPYTYVGNGGFTLTITLPDGAGNFSLGPGYGGIGFTILENVVNLSVPVNPEGESIMYFYDLYVNKHSYNFIRSIDYTAQKLDVILVIPGAGMRSGQLESGQPFIIDEQPYAHLIGENLAKDSQVNMVLENLPLNGVNFLKAGLLAAFAFVISAVVIFIFAFVKNNLSEDPEPHKHLSAKRLDLIREIAALDDDFEKGKVKEDDYRSAREKKKIDLLEVTARIGDNRRTL